MWWKCEWTLPKYMAMDNQQSLMLLLLARMIEEVHPWNKNSHSVYFMAVILGITVISEPDPFAPLPF